MRQEKVPINRTTMAASVPKETKTSRFSDRHDTYLQKQDYEYSWAIHSFREWLDEIGSLVEFSPSFPEGPATYKWKLEFEPEHKDADITYCGVFLSLKNATKAVNVKFEITMSDDKDKEIRKLCGKALFDTKRWGWYKFIARDTLLQSLENDMLLISCKIEVTAGIVSERKAVEVSAVGKNLSNDLASLLEGDEFGDATITVGKKKFLVYKGILAARSSVFAAMFKHDMVENKQNNVRIVDIEAEVFEELLRYIYTDKIDNLNAFAHQLFAAADKYCILPLKTLCQQSILANLCVQNASKTLMLADKHHAVEMKRCIMQFLGSGAARGVTDTEDWKSMIRTHPHLISEAFEATISIAGTAAP